MRLILLPLYIQFVTENPCITLLKMCGRTVLTLRQDQIQCACSYKPKNGDLYTKPQWSPEYNAGKDYTPSHNIAPTDITPVLVSSSRLKCDQKCKRILKPMMWGVIPPWHKGNYKTHNISTNNCRIENIKDSKLYSPLLKNGGRCVIVVEGFYEWQTTNKLSKIKQPYYIYSPQNENIKVDERDTWNNSFNEEIGWKGIHLMYIAGLYNIWQDGETIIYSYTVITMDSNNTLDWLHHRMPAILNTEEQIDAWLDIDNVEADLALTYLKPVKLLSWHPVSTAVNNARNKSFNCNRRITEEKNNTTQKTLNTWLIKVEKRKLPDVPNSDCKKVKK